MIIMKAKLLVVDDDHSVLASLKKLLEAEHYEVYPAQDATEAIEKFESNRIDLVILDINLGAENGWQVFQDMTVTNPFVPTIIITAEWGQREKAVALGVEGLIEKPVDVPVFLEMIRDLLAESTEEKHERICGREEYCRFVPRHYEPYLRTVPTPSGRSPARGSQGALSEAQPLNERCTSMEESPSGLAHSICENNPSIRHDTLRTRNRS